MDGFDQDEAESKRDERAVILRRLLTSKRDTFETLECGPTKFSFGSSLWPSMHLPISRMNGATLSELQGNHNEGMGVIRAPDL